MNTPHPGSLFILSAPSGTGKSTLVRRLLQELPDLAFSISYTTRPPREGEIDGQDYFFVDDATFDKMLAHGDFLEWIQVYQYRYGTSKTWIDAQRAAGTDILLDIETVGARNIKAAMPDAILLFLLPPSAQALKQRLLNRATESDEQLDIRLDHARHEMEQLSSYDYLVVNADLETAYANLKAIFLAERSRQPRMMSTAKQILAAF